MDEGAEVNLLQCPIETKRNPFGGLPRRDKKQSLLAMTYIVIGSAKNHRKQSTRLAGKARMRGRSKFLAVPD